MPNLVLVLNANFEPINVCTDHRAVSLILNGKANLVLNGRGVIRTVSRAYPRPSIIQQLGDCSDTGCYNSFPGCHGFQDRVGHAFSGAKKGNDVKSLQIIFDIGHGSNQSDEIAHV